MAKTGRERQAEYRQRHLRDVEGEKTRLDAIVSDQAMNALKRLSKHHNLTQVALLERVLLEEQQRVTAEMTDQEYEDYREYVTQ